MPAKLPKATSRDSVHVVLRESTSMPPVLTGSKRSLADKGVNLTLLESFKTAAAMARQKSTSKPVQLPLSSGSENPATPWPTPQITEPRSFTALSVCADAAATDNPSTKVARRKITRFMEQPFMDSRLTVTGVKSWRNFLLPLVGASPPGAA